MLSHKFFFGNLDTISVKRKGQIMKKNMAGLILVLFAIALFMTGCEKKREGKRRSAGGVCQTAGDPETDADRNRRQKRSEEKDESCPSRHRSKWK